MPKRITLNLFDEDCAISRPANLQKLARSVTHFWRIFRRTHVGHSLVNSHCDAGELSDVPLGNRKRGSDSYHVNFQLQLISKGGRDLQGVLFLDSPSTPKTELL